jgi:tetratricopeptide (TPR) repeat protein
LRLTEEGKRLLESGQYVKALARLEKTLAIDSTNPYVYYYLAKAHYHVGHHRESLNFLEVAESVLSGQPYWLAEVYSLKGENFRALRFLKLAVSNFNKALQLNPGNQGASKGLIRLRREIKVPSLR